MSAWDDARARLLGPMKALDVLVGRLSDGCSMAPDGLSEADRRALEALKPRVRRQLSKLVDDEFHIAVVGLEKAGKSSFINAWLEFDLLPNEQQRCTYATTELRSTDGPETQRVVIEYLDRATYEEIRRGYEERSKGQGSEANAASEDLKEMDRFEKTISANLGKAPEIRPFQDLEAICDLLRQKVANPEVARSLKSVTIYSQRLYKRRGLVFHDVPGYDSPITMHKVLAQQELARADAILFVTNLAANVTLTQAQLQMMDVADAEDPHVKASDKMFVFLNKIDSANGANDLKERIEKAKHEWVHEKKMCRAERIVPGSSGARLMEKANFIQEATRSMLEHVAGRLTQVQPPHGDGVEHLQKLVDSYLANERATVLMRRCSALLEEGRTLANKFVGALAARYPMTVEGLDQEQRVVEYTRLSAWFDRLWDEFQKKFATFWSTRVAPIKGPDDIEGRHTNFKKLEEAYHTAIGRLREKAFPTDEQIDAEALQRRKAWSTPDATNLGIREWMCEHWVDPGLGETTEALADAVLGIAEEIATWVVREGFAGVEAVRASVFPNASPTEYRALVANGLRALFLRYARPAKDIFLTTPRRTATRKNMLEVRSSDVVVLQQYYRNDDTPEHANLSRYLSTGSWVDTSGGTPHAAMPSAASTSKGAGKPVGGGANRGTGGEDPLLKELWGTPTTEPAATVQDVKTEIRQDCEAFADYLRHSVYWAAAFDEYGMQELQRIKDVLLAQRNHEARARIREVMVRAAVRGDAGVRSLLGDNLGDVDHVRRAVEQLTLVRAALSDLPGLS